MDIVMVMIMIMIMIMMMMMMIIIIIIIIRWTLHPNPILNLSVSQPMSNYRLVLAYFYIILVSEHGFDLVQA